MRGVPLRPGADHAAGAGGFVGRRQDRHQPPAGQEHDRRVLPAARVVLCDLDTLDTLPERELQRRPGRGHQVRPDRRRWLPGVDRGEHRRAAGARRRRRWRTRCAAPARSRPAWSARTSARAGCARSSTSATPSATRSRRASATAQWLHGEAVGCGMVMAANCRARLGADAAGLRASAIDAAGRAGRAAACGAARLDAER